MNKEARAAATYAELCAASGVPDPDAESARLAEALLRGDIAIDQYRNAIGLPPLPDGRGGRMADRKEGA